MSQADSSKHRILSRPHGSLDGQRNDYLGRKYSVRYEAVNAMLLNEFLKQHGAIGRSPQLIYSGRKQRLVLRSLECLKSR